MIIDDPLGDYGPVMRGRRQRLRRRRWAMSLVAAAIFVVAGMTATVGGLGWVAASGIDRVDITGPDAAPAPGAVPSETGPALEELSGVTTVLLVGTDSREGLTDEQLLRLGTRPEDHTGLTDTIIAVRLDATNSRASLLSFPRDLLLSRCDGSQGRINAAYEVGERSAANGGPWDGPSCLVNTVDDFAGISIDHYVEVDFEGFIRAVDAVGGVTFHLDEPIRDVTAGVDLPAGCTTFDGATALTFVRARKFAQRGDIGDSGGDFGRMARQQRFLREMVRKSTSLETLSQPARVLDLVGALSGAIRTDENLTPMAMARLAYTFRSLGDDGIQSFSIPVVDRQWNAAEVLEPAEGTDEVLAAFRSTGVPSPPPVAPAGTGTPAPGATVAPGAGAGTPGPPATASPAPTVDPSPSPTYNNSELSAITC